MLMKFKVRRWCIVSSPNTWPSTKKSNDTEEFVTTGSMDDCSVRPEAQFAGTRLRVDTTRVLSEGGFLSICRDVEEKPEFGIKMPLGAPLLIFTGDYLVKSSTKGYFRKTAGV